MREQTRPAIYRIMKYWGKKPHNIWRKYIEKYSKCLQNAKKLILSSLLSS